MKNFKEQKEISRWKAFRLRVAMVNISISHCKEFRSFNSQIQVDHCRLLIERKIKFLILTGKSYFSVVLCKNIV